MKPILFFVILFSYIFCCTVNTFAIEFTWSSGKPEFDKNKDVFVLIGKQSQDYSEKYENKEGGREIDLEKLPLSADSANFVALSYIDEKGIEHRSDEIVIIWSKKGMQDSDNDGLTDKFESVLGTSPQEFDSDFDGIPDGEELATWGQERVSLDFDHDNISNILDPDSDNDGVSDGDDWKIIRISSPIYVREKLQPKEATSIINVNKIEVKTIQLPKERSIDKKYSGKEASVTFFWTKNTDPDFAGYKIHYGIESKKYDIIIDVGKTKTPEQPKMEIIFKLVPGVDVYYFAATAYNTDGFESDFSTEVAYSISKANVVQK